MAQCLHEVLLFDRKFNIISYQQKTDELMPIGFTVSFILHL